MKYIFLDIDGVLNAPGDKNLIEGIVDKNKLELLKEIAINSSSKIVIISSRRIYEEDRNQLLKALDDLYYQLSFISFRINFKYRKDEIKCFLSNNKCKAYVILDDIDSNYSKDAEIFKHYVSINGYNGLTKNDTITAINILNNVYEE